jgi:hypothetical protein
MAQRIDPKTGLPLPSGPIAAGASKGGFHLSVAQVGKPMTGPPPGLEGSDLKAAASQYVSQHLASLGGGSAAAATEDRLGCAPSEVGGVARFRSEELALIPSGLGGSGGGGDDDSALSGGASLGAGGVGSLCFDAAAAAGLAAGAVAMPLALPSMFGMPAFGVTGGGWGGGAAALAPGSPSVARPSGSGGAADTAACVVRGLASAADEEEHMSDLEGMLQSMEDDEVEIGDLAEEDEGTGAAGSPAAGSGAGSCFAEGSTAAAAAALSRGMLGGGGGAGSSSGGGMRRSLGGCASPGGSSHASAPGSPHHGHHAGTALAHHSHHAPSPLSRAGAVSPFAAFQGPGGGLFGGCDDIAGLEPGVEQASEVPRWDSSISTSSCQHHGASAGGAPPTPAAVLHSPGLRHLLPPRPATASVSLSCRTEDWEEEVKAVGSPHAPRCSCEAATAGSPEHQQQQPEWPETVAASSSAVPWPMQRQAQQQAQQHSANQELENAQVVAQQPACHPPQLPGSPADSLPGTPVARRVASEPAWPQGHLCIRLAGIAAAAAQQADEAANGGTPVAASTPGIDMGCLALGTPSATALRPPMPAPAGAFGMVPVGGGAGSAGLCAVRAPSGGFGMFGRQPSLGLQEAMPLDWDAFGRAASMMPRPSNDDGGAFEALLGSRCF